MSQRALSPGPAQIPVLPALHTEDALVGDRHREQRRGRDARAVHDCGLYDPGRHHSHRRRLLRVRAVTGSLDPRLSNKMVLLRMGTAKSNVCHTTGHWL